MNHAEQFPALGIPEVAHAFTLRVPGLNVRLDREAALQALEQTHGAVRNELGLGDRVFATATQVHGSHVARVTAGSSFPVPDADALITDDPRLCLGVYVADCGPIYLVDPERRAIGLAHSGRKGTELGIARVTVERMAAEFGCVPSRMIAQLGPCIRPPLYEIDFARAILEQCRAAGVGQVHDCGTCTGTHLERYYSYRVELGRTGRMLALLALAG
jgi:copper oxidase (laccase) domain-containing protein